MTKVLITLVIATTLLVISHDNQKPSAENVYQDKELIECPGIFNYETEKCEIN